MKILVCNAGSTSLKFKLYSMPDERVLAEARMERVGSGKTGAFAYAGRGEPFKEALLIPDYESGIRRFLKELCGMERGVLADAGEIGAVGFKTVLSRGFYGVHPLTPEVMKGMEEMLSVAPAHNRHYLAAVSTFRRVLPDTPMIGVFETAFHQTLPEEAYTYALPYEWREKYGIRRLGYHGASHAYVADWLKARLGPEFRAVSCHLGGSSSLCAIRDGRSVENSFGLSLQAGLPQGNRAGDIDPFLIRRLMEDEGIPAEEIFRALEERSGLLGLSGVSGDMRDIELAAEAGSQRADLAIKVYCHELLRYIGGYAAVMGGLDAVAFTGGIGENSRRVRDDAMERLRFLGVEPSGAAPEPGRAAELTRPGSRVRVFVIPANEELGISRKVYDLLKRGARDG